MISWFHNLADTTLNKNLTIINRIANHLFLNRAVEIQTWVVSKNTKTDLHILNTYN